MLSSNTSWSFIPDQLSATADMVMRVANDAMSEFQIFPGDELLIRQTSETSSGNLVLISYKGDLTVRTFFQKDGVTMLLPANEQGTILYPDDTNCIFGQVLLVRRYHQTTPIAQCEQLISVLNQQLNEPHEPTPIFRLDIFKYDTCLATFRQIIRSSKSKQHALQRLSTKPEGVYFTLANDTRANIVRELNQLQDKWQFTTDDIDKCKKK